ncbi:MAG: aspartate aminotransferase family protein [Candidatus Eisenbacteria bacterium]
MSDTLTPPAAPDTRSAATAEAALFAPVYAPPRLVLVSGHGAWVSDETGREYLDFVSGIAVNALGHAPAGLARVVAKQMRTLVHTSNLYVTPPALALAEALTRATGYERVFFCNSGTEGVEAALKFARVVAGARGRPGRDIVAFRGGFHGRTGFSLSATWTPSYREPFEPLVPGVRFADLNDLAGLDTALDDQVCAVIVEPIQGEGGVVSATPEFLRALHARTATLGALLVLDEIQCGMGRTGKLLASEHAGVRGDLVVMSKALGGGLPLGAVLMSAGVAATLAPGMHGTTLGGGPVTTTAGLWMLERINKPGFLARVRKSGRRLRAGLDTLVAKHRTLAQARGLGLLTAIDVAPDAPFAPADLILAARAHGLLVARAADRAVRLLPPLDVKPAEIDAALERLDAALHSLATQETPHS